MVVPNSHKCKLATDKIPSEVFQLVTSLEVTAKVSTEMMTWRKRIRCGLLSCTIVPVLFLSMKCPLTTGVVIFCRILYVLFSLSCSCLRNILSLPVSLSLVGYIPCYHPCLVPVSEIPSYYRCSYLWLLLQV